MIAADILRRVCAFREVPVTKVLNKNGCASVRAARREAAYLIRRHTRLSSTEIGQVMRRDHSSVLAAVRTVEIEIEFGRGDEYLAELDSILAPVSFAHALQEAA